MVLVLVLFCAGMIEVKRIAVEWQVRNLVLVVNNAEAVMGFRCNKFCKFLVTTSGLAEIGHSYIKAIFDQAHLGQKGKGCAETVSCSFNRVSWVDSLQSLNLS